MAGMAAEGREIPIADRELTRGRRGTHSDRAHHHRRWFRAPARCALLPVGGRGFDRRRSMPAVRALLLSWGYAVSTASRRSMPVGDRRSAVRAFCSVGGTRFRPPPGGRCRSETGAPPSARFAQLGVRGFDRLSAVDAGRRPALRRPRAFAQLGVRGFDRLPAVDAGRRPALRRPRAFAQLGYAVSTASRRSMPVGDRRSAVRARFRRPALRRPRAQLGVRGFDRLSAVDAGRRPALRRPRACSRSTMRDLDARRAVRNPGC